MSAIDKYKHELLDFFECPSDYQLVYENSTTQIAIYMLLEDIPNDEKDFDGKAGDILVGGGSGEAQAMRISQKGLKFFVEDSYDDFDSRNELVRSFWSSTFAFKLGNGLIKLGWQPDQAMEFWLAEKVINQLKKKNKITVPNKV